MARKLRDMTIFELLDEWRKEIQRVYGSNLETDLTLKVINISTRDRKKIIAIDMELTKKLGLPKSKAFRWEMKNHKRIEVI